MQDPFQEEDLGILRRLQESHVHQLHTRLGTQRA